MNEKPKYSWTYIFDSVKEAAGQTLIIEMKSGRKFSDPVTPRTLSGYSYWYARYDAFRDAVWVWGYGSKTREWRDPEEGYSGMEIEREKWEGLRNRLGEWIEPLTQKWE